MAKKTYDYRTHSISCLHYYEGVYYLTINFLELMVKYDTDELLEVYGFLPIFNVPRCNIELPVCGQEKYYLKNVKKDNIQQGNIYNYFDKIDYKYNYFNPIKTMYDEEKGIICLGDTCISDTDNVFRINKNVVCVADVEHALKCIYIIPDLFVQ